MDSTTISNADADISIAVAEFPPLVISEGAQLVLDHLGFGDAFQQVYSLICEEFGEVTEATLINLPPTEDEYFSCDLAFMIKSPLPWNEFDRKAMNLYFRVRRQFGDELYGKVCLLQH